MTRSNPASESTRLSLALLTYLLGIIAVVTLLPFRFHWPSRWELIMSAGAFDGITNVCLFLPLGFLYRRARRRQDDRYCLQAVVFGGTISLGIELAQLFQRGRYTSPMDLAANAIGAWIGAMLYDGVERRLHQRLVGKLALELPLMTLFYLLLPLLWLNSLATGREVSRLWLTPLLGLCGGSILAAVWKYRLQPAGVLSANALALIVPLWFLVGSMPGFAKRPWFLVLCSIGLGVGIRLQMGWPRRIGNERRFELSTLWRIWPIYATYVCLMALWPWPWVPRPWRASLGFSDVSEVPHVIPTLRVVEYIAAFTLLGYMVAQCRGRRDEPVLATARWLLGYGVVVAGLLECIRGFHPAYIASLAHLLLAVAATLYGGVVYHLQLTTVHQLLTTPRHQQGVEIRIAHT